MYACAKDQNRKEIGQTGRNRHGSPRHSGAHPLRGVFGALFAALFALAAVVTGEFSGLFGIPGGKACAAAYGSGFESQYNGHFCINDKAKSRCCQRFEDNNGKLFGFSGTDARGAYAYAGADSSNAITMGGNAWNIEDSYLLWNTAFVNNIFLYHDSGFYYNGKYYDVIEFPRLEGGTSKTIDGVTCRETYAIRKDSGFSYAHPALSTTQTSSFDTAVTLDGKKVYYDKDGASRSGRNYVERRFFFYEHSDDHYKDIRTATVNCSTGAVSGNAYSWKQLTSYSGVFQAADLDILEWMSCSGTSSTSAIQRTASTDVKLATSTSGIIPPGRTAFSGAIAYGTVNSNSSDDDTKAWFPFSVSSGPLTIYDGPGTAAGAGVNYSDLTITLHIVQNDRGTCPSWVVGTSESVTGVKYLKYSENTLMFPSGINVSKLTASQAVALENCEFDGWYVDAGLTTTLAQALTSDPSYGGFTNNMLTADMDLYGTYDEIRYTYTIMTSATNGTIYPSPSCEVEEGASQRVTYSPDDGYLLSCIVVDGEPVNIDDYPNSYTFSNVTKDHVIEVAYVEAPEVTKLAMTPTGALLSADSNGEAVETVKQAGDTLIYEIAFVNPAEAAKTFTITDPLPGRAGYVECDNGGAYDEDTHTVTWKRTVKAGKQCTQTVTVRILDNAVGKILTNRASVAVDRVLVDTNEVKTPVLSAPVKDMVQDGASIDGMQVVVGEEFDYTVTFTNPADSEKTAKVTDPLPKGVTFVSADADGAYDEKSHTVTWNVDLSGHETKTVTATVKVPANAIDTELNNRARVAIDDAELSSFTPGGTETTAAFVTGKHVYNADGEEICGEVQSAGNELTYTITYKNVSDEYQTFTIRDVLPHGVTFLSASGTSEVTENEDGSEVVTWTIKAESGKEGHVTAKVKVASSGEGLRVGNTATVTVTGEDGGERTVTTNEAWTWTIGNVVKTVEYSGVYGEENRYADEAREAGTVDDQAETDGTAETDEGAVGAEDNNAEGAILAAGDEIVYGIALTNPADSERKCTVTDALPEQVEFLEASDDGEEKDGTVTWDLTLQANETKRVTVRVKTKDANKGEQFENQASVRMEAAGVVSNVIKNSIMPDPTLAVKDEDGKTLDGKSVVGNTKLTYETSVTNPSDEEKLIAIEEVLDKQAISEVTEISDGGSEIEGGFLWSVPVGAGETKTVTVDAVAADVTEETLVTSQSAADVTEEPAVGTLPTNEVETTIVPADNEEPEPVTVTESSEPSEPSHPEATYVSQLAAAVKTGDPTVLWPYLAGIGVAAFAALLAFLIKRRRAS